MIHGGEIYDKKIELDLSVNLNPYPCPQQVKESLRAAIDDVDKYPDIFQTEFRSKIAEAENMNTDLITTENVIGGNGASELISAIVRYIKPHSVLLPVPSFYGYRHALLPYSDIEIKEYYLRQEDDFVLSEEFCDYINEGTDLVVIANPNNPTGKCIEADVLKKIIRKCADIDIALIVDECFLHLSDCGESAIKYVSQCPKLFIINAYTKLFSIPGVRVGYAISQDENIKELRHFLPEWNMSVFAQRVGVTCADILMETDFLQKSVSYIKTERQKLMEHLSDSGYKVYPSDTNFILIYSDEDLYTRYLERGILIRDCSNFVGLSKGFYRIAVRSLNYMSDSS